MPAYRDEGGGSWVRDSEEIGGVRVERYRPRVEGLFACIEKITIDSEALPTEWYAFLHPSGTSEKTLQFNISRRHFPYFAQHGDLEITAVWLFVRSDTGDPMVASLELPLVPPETIALPPPANPDQLQVGNLTDLAELLDESQPWRLRLRKDAGTFNGITAPELEEAFLVVQYTT